MNNRLLRSVQLFEKAQQLIPGGVNSPVRAFGGVGGTPVFFDHGKGAYLYDADGNCYIDYVGSWGPLILGHAHPSVVALVEQTLRKGLTFGAPTELEVQMAERIKQLMPNLEMIRMVTSGTEAGMSVIRLARAYTKRHNIIKFDGCYHGHNDSLLIKGGSGLLTFGQPSSPGVPTDLAAHTLVARFNDLNQVEQLFQQHGETIAAIIIEPIAANMNCVLPNPGFLQGLRKLCDQYQSLLIVDEVITGFRVALGGAQALYQIKPDLTMLGKVVGGGMPIAAYGGRKEIMQLLSPIGPVYQAGTLSGNPLAMAAGLATLNEISVPGFYEKLSAQTEKLMTGLADLAHAAKIPLQTVAIGGLFGFFFTEQKQIENLDQVKDCDLSRFQKFFHGMLQAGIYLAPSMYEAGFVSIAHGDHEIQTTLQAAQKVFKTL